MLGVSGAVRKGGSVPHLAIPRLGWENEHLATYLLSQIAFVANPITVADDIGFDLLCTLFEPRSIEGRKRLFPLRSFAIQIKSSNARFRADSMIDYLKGLELPFFLGIIARSDLSLSIYSGEFLPMMVTHLGPPSRLGLRPVQQRTLGIGDAYRLSRGTHELKLPYVLQLTAGDDASTRDENRKALSGLCSRMHANISTRVSKEYIYQLDDRGSYQIQAGPGSVTTFRRNLYLRLAEVFYNLEWLLENRPMEFDQSEYELYDDLYESLSTMHDDLPDVLHTIRGRLRNRLAATG